MADFILGHTPTLQAVLNAIGLVSIVLAVCMNILKGQNVVPLLLVAAVSFTFGNLDKFTKFGFSGFTAELRSEVRAQVSDVLDVRLSKVDPESLKTVPAQGYTNLAGYCDPDYKATGISLKSLSPLGVPVLQNLTATEKPGQSGYSVEVQNGGGNGRPPVQLQLQVVCLGLKS